MGRAHLAAGLASESTLANAFGNTTIGMAVTVVGARRAARASCGAIDASETIITYADWFAIEAVRAAAVLAAFLGAFDPLASGSFISSVAFAFLRFGVALSFTAATFGAGKRQVEGGTVFAAVAFSALARSAKASTVSTALVFAHGHTAVAAHPQAFACTHTILATDTSAGTVAGTSLRRAGGPSPHLAWKRRIHANFVAGTFSGCHRALAVYNVADGAAGAFEAWVAFAKTRREAAAMGHAVLWTDSHGASASSKTLFAHACLVFANAAVVARWVTSFFVAKFSSPLRVALARVGVVALSNASTMVVAVLFAPPVFHVARISRITSFTLASTTSLAQSVSRTLLWTGFDIAAGTCPACDASALTGEQALTLSRATVRASLFAVKATVSSVTFDAFWLSIRISSAASVTAASVLARVLT